MVTLPLVDPDHNHAIIADLIEYKQR